MKRCPRYGKPHIYLGPNGYWCFKSNGSITGPFTGSHPFAQARSWVNKQNGKLRRRKNGKTSESLEE